MTMYQIFNTDSAAFINCNPLFFNKRKKIIQVKILQFYFTLSKDWTFYRIYIVVVQDLFTFNDLLHFIYEKALGDFWSKV